MRIVRIQYVVGIATVLAATLSPAVSYAKINSSVTLSWSSPIIHWKYSPGGGFSPGHQPALSLLSSEARSICNSKFGFSLLSIEGASGLQLGHSQFKADINNIAKVVRGSWTINSYGENEYDLDVSCSGFLKSPVSGPSKAYTVSLYQTVVNSVTNQKFNQQALQSPEYPVDVLSKSNWKISVALGLDSDGYCCNSEALNTWVPPAQQSDNQNYDGQMHMAAHYTTTGAVISWQAPQSSQLGSYKLSMSVSGGALNQVATLPLSTNSYTFTKTNSEGFSSFKVDAISVSGELIQSVSLGLPGIYSGS